MLPGYKHNLTDLQAALGIHQLARVEYYRETFGYRREDFPNATWISDRTVSLPLSPHLSDDDVARVIAAVRAVV